MKTLYYIYDTGTGKMLGTSMEKVENSTEEMPDQFTINPVWNGTQWVRGEELPPIEQVENPIPSFDEIELLKESDAFTMLQIIDTQQQLASSQQAIADLQIQLNQEMQTNADLTLQLVMKGVL